MSEVDARHGWMVLNGDPGASMLPEMPEHRPTAERRGSVSQRWEYRRGEDFPQLLIARSSQAHRSSPAEIEGPKHPETSEYGELLVSRTDDGGQTWSLRPLCISRYPTDCLDSRTDKHLGAVLFRCRFCCG